MAKERQGAQKRGENVRSYAVNRFPDGVGDGVSSWSEEGEHFVRAAEITSAVSAVQSAKGRRMEELDRERCGGKKWLSEASLI